MTILAAVDGERRSKREVAVGSELADAFQEELVVLNVMSWAEFEAMRESVTGLRSADVSAPILHRTVGSERSTNERVLGDGYYVDEAAADAASTARSVTGASIEDASRVSVRGSVGDPVTEILGEAGRQDARYVVVGGRKRSAVGKSIFGSVTQSVLLRADRPVVTVRKRRPDLEDVRSGPIVAAVDDDHRAPRIVEEARVLAEAVDRELHVVHVISKRGFVDRRRTVVARTGATIPTDRVRDATRTVGSEAAASVTDESRTIGLVGRPRPRILRYADDVDAGYIVLAGRKRSPVGKLIFGSVTQSVVLGAHRPVVTVVDGPQ